MLRQLLILVLGLPIGYFGAMSIHKLIKRRKANGNRWHAMVGDDNYINTGRMMNNNTKNLLKDKEKARILTEARQLWVSQGNNMRDILERKFFTFVLFALTGFALGAMFGYIKIALI